MNKDICAVRQMREKGKFVADQPFTPLSLMQEITEQLPVNTDASVLVLFTVEWALYLKELGYVDITVSADDPIIANICAKRGLNYISIKELENNKNMKFDVVVGNPPYGKITEDSRQREFYQQFVYGAHALAPVVALVYPARWTSVNNASYKKFSNFLIDANLTVFKWLPSNIFPGVQMLTCYTITDQTGVYKETKVVDQNNNFSWVNIKDIEYYPSDFRAISVLTKLGTHSGLSARALSGSLYENQLDAGGTNKIVFRAGRTNEPIPYYFGSADNAANTKLVNEFKVIVSRNGAERKLGPVKVCDYDAGVGFACFGFRTESEQQSINLVNYLNTTIVKFIVDQYKRGTKGNSKELFSRIPEIDLNREWTDAELYAHFNLTQEEIELVESTVK